MGSVERSIALQCARDGTPLPDRIQNKPRLFGGLQFILESFFELDSERHHGSGLQKIPWSSIIKYIEYNGIEDRDDFIYLIRRLDNENLKKLDSEQKARMKSK